MERYDVVIVGAGLAGLTLARHLLLSPGDRRILLVEKRVSVPPEAQKVGEATVQVSGYYLSKVLDLEEHLLREHFMKYNLRFYWKTAGRTNASFEDYSQSYIRSFSNIAGYQLDRNKVEAELLRLNRDDRRFTFCPAVTELHCTLEEPPHRVSFKVGGTATTVEANWLVDTSGRGGFLARRLGLQHAGSIRHGASFMWVDGLLNIEKLTDLSAKASRVHRSRSAVGHGPLWLATNHFVGEGFWFWVIPLQGKTSLGLVYEASAISYDRVSSAQKLTDWVCGEFPLFARDLPHRRILHHAGYRDFAFDCTRTIHQQHWALSGEAGRFSDPLYSPGGDLISLYNTLIVDAILTADDRELPRKTAMYEQLMRAFYEAYVPGFAVSYNALGDQEAMALKYGWELTIYFGFYVFPFINELFTDLRFASHFLRRFTELGRVNRGIQRFISAYYGWKHSTGAVSTRQVFFDFMEIGPLRESERAFYDVGVTVDEAIALLDLQFANVHELARFIVAHVASQVVSDRRALWNRGFIEDVDLAELEFDVDAIRSRYAQFAGAADQYVWSFDPTVLDPFRPRLGTEAAVTVRSREDPA
jgi:flavin-dependent dehydrogenase